MFFKKKNTIVNNLLMICMHISIVKKKKNYTFNILKLRDLNTRYFYWNYQKMLTNSDTRLLAI